MQTFLPYSDYFGSLYCLDNKRLGKQRVEAWQILNILLNKKTGAWSNHPAVLMWKGYEEALKLYYKTSLEVWVNRGFNNSMKPMRVNYDLILWPVWLGNEKFHASHRANLKRKANESLIKYFELLGEGKEKRALQYLKVYDWYKQFHWKEDPNLPYVWPSKVGL